MKNKYDYLIVGSGLMGSTLAYNLKQKGYDVLVIDKRNKIAGNIYTENKYGINVHKYGAHIFHTSDKRCWDFINLFATFNNYVNTPIANYHGKLYNLPFNMNTFTKLFDDVKTPEDAKNKIEEEIKKYGVKEPKNLEEQAISLVGKTVFETLIKGYTEKQWGKKCEELPPSIIKRIPVRYTFNNNYFNDLYQGIPIGGYTKIIEKMLNGIDLLLNTSFKDIKNKYQYDKLIYTGMIDEYYDYCFGELEYRSLKFEEEVINTNNYQGNAVINYTDYETPYTRIIEHRHFEFNLEGDKTIITKEYPIKFEKGMESYYPLNNEKNTELYNKYKSLNKDENIIFLGRLAEYKYYDMDDTIIKAFEYLDTVKEK